MKKLQIFETFICENLFYVLWHLSLIYIWCYLRIFINSVLSTLTHLICQFFVISTRYEALRVAFIHSEDVGVEGKKEFYSKLVKADIHGKDQVHYIHYWC